MPEHDQSLRLTQEQLNARELFATRSSLKIAAFAGAGKTATLCALAQSRPGRTGLYLAFNRSVADEAARRFPDHAVCRTSHSIAYEAIMRQHAFARDRLSGALTARQLAQLYGFKDAWFGPRLRLNGVQQAYLIMSVVQKFCQSSDDEIGRRHVPLYGRLRGAATSEQFELIAWAVKAAAVLWRRMTAPGDTLPLGHDGYLKLWSLGRPKLEFDYILLDEAQDSNPALLAVLGAQDAQVVYVGDKHQQIYEWRGAHNAMESVQGCAETCLTQSFRFGSAIADSASAVLASLSENRRLIGNPAVASEILDDNTVGKAVLARTNVSVMQEVVTALAAKRTPCVVGGTADLIRLLNDVANLKQQRPAMTPELFGFSSWSDVVEISRKKEGAEWRTLVQLVGRYGEGALLQALKETTDNETAADLIVSTAHKSKGRQWDSVRIVSDFLGPQVTKGARSEVEAEVRLFYVAMTRARRRLCVNEGLLRSFTSGALMAKFHVDPHELEPPDGRAQSACETQLAPPPARIDAGSRGLGRSSGICLSEGRNSSPPPREASPLIVAERTSSRPAGAMRRSGVKDEPAQLARSPASPMSGKPDTARSVATMARNDAATRFLWLKRSWLAILGRSTKKDSQKTEP